MNLSDGHADQSSAENAALRPITWIENFVSELLVSVDSIMSNINRTHEEDDETILQRIQSQTIGLDEFRLLRCVAEESVSDWRREEFCRMTAEVTEAYREFCSLAYNCFRDQPADVDLSDAGPECYERVMKVIDALSEAIYWIPNAHEILEGVDDVDDVAEAESGIPFEQLVRITEAWDRELKIFKLVTNKLIEGGIPPESISRLKTFEHLIEFLEISPETPDSRIAWELHQAADLLLAKRHANFPLPASGPSAGQPDKTNGKPQKKKLTSTKQNNELKIVAALLKHHQYESGSCLNDEAIEVRQLAALAGPSPATVTRFFQAKFKKKGYAGYQSTCRNKSSLLGFLQGLSGDINYDHLHLGDQDALVGIEDDEIHIDD